MVMVVTKLFAGLRCDDIVMAYIVMVVTKLFAGLRCDGLSALLLGFSEGLAPRSRKKKMHREYQLPKRL